MALARGMDISIFQPNIDWDKVIAGTGISFVLVRVGDGSLADPLFARHWTEAKQAGLLRGAYFFLRQSVSAEQQAQMLLQALGGDAGELPPVVDIEDPRVNAPATYAGIALAWLNAVQTQLNRQPIIYTGAWWWNPNMLIGGQYPDWAPGYPLWVASYPLKSSVPTTAQIDGGVFAPILPKSWTAWSIWQYSGDVATVDGITDDRGRPAHVDFDAFNGTLDDLKAMAQTPLGSASGAASAGGAVPAGTAAVNGAGTGVATPGLALPDPRVTNQVMINAFRKAFGSGYWDVVLRCGLGSLADDRQAVYSGPAIAALAALAADEQTALQTKLVMLATGG
jgi:lysozyme